MRGVISLRRVGSKIGTPITKISKKLSSKTSKKTRGLRVGNLATKNYFAYESANSNVYEKIRAPLSPREKLLIGALILFGLIIVFGPATRATTADKGSIFSSPSTNCQAVGDFAGPEKASGQPESTSSEDISITNSSYWGGNKDGSLACTNFESDLSHVRVNPALTIYTTEKSDNQQNQDDGLSLADKNFSPLRISERPAIVEPNVYGQSSEDLSIDGLLMVSISYDKGETWNKFHELSPSELKDSDGVISLALPVAFNRDLKDFAVKVEPAISSDSTASGVLIDAFTVIYEVGDAQELSMNIANASKVDETTVISSSDTISAEITSKNPGDGVVQGAATQVFDAVTNPDPPNVIMTAVVAADDGTKVVNKEIFPEYKGADMSNADAWDINVAMPESVDPGKYTLDVTVTYEDGTYQTLSQDFLWGVLAMNFDKSPYLVGDTSKIDMTVLDDTGRSVCDAKVELTVTSPSGQTTNMTTDNQYIVIGSKCEEYGDFIDPDYTTNFTFNELGDYKFSLKASTDSGSYTIGEIITTLESSPYTIARSGPTRVFPPETYPMKISVTAKEDFEGTVSDVIPSSFNVKQKASDSFTIRKEDNQQYIEWQTKMSAGETKEFVYNFEAPQISPEFYLFGPVKLKNIQGYDVFEEQRQWQIAGDAVGRMLLFWDGGAAPTGWTCVSCVGGDPFYQRFIRGEATYGATGGTATHTHTATGAVANQGTTASEARAGATVSITLHTHNYSPTLTSPSNLPTYRQLNVIRSNTAGTPTSIPAGAIAIFDAAVPSGWTQYAAQDGSYVRGESTAGTTGGSNTHTVGISGTTTNAAGGNQGPRTGGTTASTALAAHNHTVSGTSASSTNEPPYVEAILGKLNSTATPTVDMIAMWDDSAPGGWQARSGSGDPFYQRFIKPSATYGTTGGTSTHTHADTNGITSGAPSAAANHRVSGSGSAGDHTHSVNVTGYSNVSHIPPYIDVVMAKRMPQPTYEQSAFRVFNNTDSEDVGSAIGAQDAAVTAPEQGTPFRLRTALHIGTNQLESSGQDFKLQYAVRSGTCDTLFSGETYADVATGSGAIRYYDNATPADDAALTDNVNDPVHSGHTNVNQTYEEANNFTNSQAAVPSGSDGLWDFSLVDFSASSNTTYCFRIIKSDDSLLDTYNVIPQITTATTTVTQSAYRLFENTDSADVGPDLANQDTPAITPATGTPFRMRLSLHVAGSRLAPSGQTYKLQFAQRSGTCDTSFTGETYVDLAAGSGTIRYHNNPTPADGATMTSNVNDPVHSGHTQVDQTYEEANNFTNSVGAIPANQDGVWDFALVDNSAPQDTSYCFRVVTSAGTPLDSYSVIPEITTAGVNITQSAFRWFNNTDSTDVGSTLAAQDSAATAPNQGIPFRLRMSLHIASSNLTLSAQNFKLQYAVQSGTCDTNFTGETYADVETASGAIRYYDNPTPTDGANLTSNANDPIHSGHTKVSQTYEESNNFTNSTSAVNVGEDGMWDFSLVDNSANASTAYCFRIVKANGAEINSYSVVPQITTTAVVLEQSAYRWMENTDSTDVGTVLAAQDSAATAPYQGVPFRLRMNIHISSRTLNTGDETFKLQFAARSGTCDTLFTGETYIDVQTGAGAFRYYDNATPADGDALTGNVNDPVHSGHSTTDQTYEEANNFTSTSNISSGDDGMWDFSLVDFSASPTTTYCFRIVYSNGSTLNTYSVIPEITTEINVGSMIMYYDGVSIPTGWTCVSCNPGEDFYQRFARGESTYGGTGGAATHTHTASGAVSATGGAAATESQAGATVSNNTHGHNYTPAIDSQSNLPNYRQLKVIKRDLPGPATTLPTGVIGMFNATVPTGWTRYSAQDTYYIRGEGTAATTGGADTHTHVINGSTSAATGAAVAPRLTGGQSPAATNTHTHSVTSATASTNKEPPYIQTILGQINSSGAVPSGLIVMWDDVLPTGWASVSDSGDPFYQRFAKGSATYGTTGGAVSHSHANVNGITSSAPVGTTTGRTGTVGSSDTHTHSVNVTSFSTDANLPPYVNVIFGSNDSNTAPDTPTALNQVRVTANTPMSVGDWTDETQVRFEADATDPDNPDTIQLCVEVKAIGNAFTNTEDSCGIGAAYSGSAVTPTVTVTGLTNNTEYHWQVRTKDTTGAYSSWVQFGGNAEVDRDFGIDTTNPTGTVYDGSTVAVDIEFNNGSLSQMSANWSFNFNVSGQDGNYEYSIGTTGGATDVLNWTSTALTTVTASSLTLNTSQPYYFNVRASDNAGNQATISSDGQFVAPTISFSTSPTNINIGTLNSGNSFTSTANTTLTTSTNAYNGYIIRGFAQALLESQNNDTIGLFTGGSYASPDEWLPGDTGYGYHSSDVIVNGVNRFNGGPCAGGGNPPCFAPWSLTFPGDIIADHTSLVSGTAIANEQFTITHRVTTATNQAAGNYRTSIVYGVTARY